MGLLGIRGKANNDRRYPGESNRNRPDRAEDRRVEASSRQEISDSLSPQQKLDKLDMKFGAGQGAQKERAKLQLIMQNGGKPKLVKKDAAIEALENATLPPEVMAEIEAMNNEDGGMSKKKLKAKDRRARDKKSGS